MGEAANALQEASRDASNVEQEERIQKIVDDLTEAIKTHKFEQASPLQEELRSLGVTLNRADLSWTGPGGLSGAARRPGAWVCASCNKVNFKAENRSCHFCK